MNDRRTNDERLAAADSFVRNNISEKRYAHTIRVAETAEELAKIHGLDRERVRLAALLHDAARELRQDEFLRAAADFNLPVDEPEKENPKLLHGPVAAELARRELGVEDEAVLEAVRAHTVGSPGMGPIALALYVADKIEPARDYPSAGRLRELANKDLYEAAAESIRRTHAHNEERGRYTHPASVRTLQWLEQTIYRRVDERDGEPGEDRRC